MEVCISSNRPQEVLRFKRNCAALIAKRISTSLLMPGGTFTLRLEIPQRSTGRKEELDWTRFWAMPADNHLAHRPVCARDLDFRQI